MATNMVWDNAGEFNDPAIGMVTLYQCGAYRGYTVAASEDESGMYWLIQTDPKGKRAYSVFPAFSEDMDADDCLQFCLEFAENLANPYRG